MLTVLTERATRDTELTTEGIDKVLADANQRAVGSDEGGRRKQAEADQQRARSTRSMAAKAGERS